MCCVFDDYQWVFNLHLSVSINMTINNNVKKETSSAKTMRLNKAILAVKEKFIWWQMTDGR